jgi:hypothetical protein
MGRKGIGASHLHDPHPHPPFWEKGLGDEGKFANLGCTRMGFIERQINW